MNHAKHPSAGNPRVSLTGYATASAWAHFGFEYADWFDSRRGRALFLPMHYGCRALRPIAPAAGAFSESLYWRHRWFSAWAEAQAPNLAIEIGAGLSTRGIAHARKHPDMHWVDYDLADMVAARRARLAKHDVPGNYTLEVGDLLGPGLGGALRTSADARVIAMTEGVTDYLDHAEKRRAWRAIAELLARLGGGRYLLEVHPRERIDTFGMPGRLLFDALRRISGRDLREQLCANTDEAIAMLEDCGFTRVRVLPEDELVDAAHAPAPAHRAFVLIEACIQPGPDVARRERAR
ncbi:hypothetical protein T5B8_01160 [Salinisphaera sp. T5B8]|uniref:hypothetical protein n=1 Tax=Salinisphaera sp. T5B8 TaxID=1304154 RepID=UPI00333F542D